MNVIKLNANWVLQLIVVVVIAVVMSFTMMFFTHSLKLLAVAAVLAIIIVTILNVMNLRFLHCYKAGIYYSQGLGKQYISKDEIVDIQFHSLKLLTVLVVTLENQKVVRFYNWQFDAQAQQSIRCWYSKKKKSCNNLQQTPCSA